MKRALALLLPLLVAAAAFTALWLQTTPPPRPPPPGAATYGDFTVQTSSGALSLSDLRGRVVVLYFGYTSCPDICPTTMAALNAAFRRLPSEVTDAVTVLMISVDPERDDLERLAEYAGFFNPSFRAGTAEPSKLSAIAKDWGVAFRYEKSDASQLDYLVDHSTSAFLIDARGALLRTLPHGLHPQEIADAIQAAVSDAKGSEATSP